MTIAFNADEILQMAERIEQNGVKFYSLASERFPSCRDMFDKLAKQEEEHRVIFAGMRKTLSATEKEAPTYDPDQETNFYLAAMADRKVFPLDQDPRQLFPASISLSGLIDTAIGKEKDSIVFYVAMKEMVPGNLGQEKISLIIKEEFRHISVLRALAIKN